MEHRCGERVSVNLKAMVYQPDMPPAVCKVVNIGADGVFIKTASLTCPPSTAVDIVVPLEVAGKVRRWRLGAMVVHTAMAGAGLMFMSTCMDIFQTAKGISSHYSVPMADNRSADAHMPKMVRS